MTRYKYSSFAELKREKREGLDYRIELVDRGSAVVVMAPHGGKIEPYTTELAKLVTNDDFSFYSFVGCQARSNLFDLHVESHLYDEEQALALVSAAQTVLAIHGERSRREQFVMIGGLHLALREAVAEVAVACDIPVREATAGLGGLDSGNICNRGQLGAGVQIEASRALRDALRSQHELRTDFVAGLRRVLLTFERETGP